jgi:hypothetical protein
VLLASKVCVHLVYFGKQRSHAFATARRWRLRVAIRDGERAKCENKATQDTAGSVVHAGLFSGKRDAGKDYALIFMPSSKQKSKAVQLG